MHWVKVKVRGRMESPFGSFLAKTFVESMCFVVCLCTLVQL